MTRSFSAFTSSLPAGGQTAKLNPQDLENRQPKVWRFLFWKEKRCLRHQTTISPPFSDKTSLTDDERIENMSAAPPST